MNRELLAWAGGFFDGEGSVHICYRYISNKTGKQIRYPQVSISQSGLYAKELLLKFQNALNIPSKIYGPIKPAKNQKQVRYMFEASGFEKTQAIAAMLWNFIGTTKKQKFASVLKEAYGRQDNSLYQ